MQLKNGHFVFSPSDVTAFLACQHATALALRVARGEIEAPPFENEQADLVFRKGDARSLNELSYHLVNTER